MTPSQLFPVVLYCTCHDTLSDRLPAQALAQALAQRYPHVQVMALPTLCTPEGCAKAMGSITQGTPLLVAACSSLAKGHKACTILQRLNPKGPVGLVDLREGCVWCSAHTAPNALLAKAVDNLSMGLAALVRHPTQKAEPALANSVPTSSHSAPPCVAVIGAGPAGLAAAATLVDAGLATVLIDRRPATGGMLNQVGRLFPFNTPTAQLLDPLRRVDHPQLTTRLGETVVAATQHNKGFALTLKKGGTTEELFAQAVILATGSQPILPGTRYRAKEVRGVISQMELETLLTAVESGTKTVADLPTNMVCIQCVGAREDAAPYCSAICCPTALKNALRLKEQNPKASVTILHRNMVTPGAHLEALYRQAMGAGIVFTRYAVDTPPQIEGSETVQAVRVRCPATASETILPADRVVCSTPLRPTPDTAVLARGLGLRLDNMGFVCGREPLFPLEPAVAGVYICGAARWPVYAAQAEDQGRAAGLKAALFVHETALNSPLAEVQTDGQDSGPAATVVPERCSGCGRCALACPYDACQRVLYSATPSAPKIMEVIEARCRRCGTCAAQCPTGAIQLPQAAFDTFRAQLHEAMAVASSFTRRLA